MKTKEEIIRGQYVYQVDIQELLGVGRTAAKKIFERCLKKDYDELQDRIIYTNKVRLTTVLEDQGIKLRTLLNQIRN